MRILLATAILLALPLLPIDTAPYSATLTSAYGTGSARAGIEGVRFLAMTERPALLINELRGVVGDALVGDVHVASEVTDTEAMTLTVTLTDSDTDPTLITMSGPCPWLEAPVGASAWISATVSDFRCNVAGECSMAGIVDSVGGIPCR